jgi:hypothetical protein
VGLFFLRGPYSHRFDYYRSYTTHFWACIKICLVLSANGSVSQTESVSCASKPVMIYCSVSMHDICNSLSLQMVPVKYLITRKLVTPACVHCQHHCIKWLHVPTSTHIVPTATTILKTVSVAARLRSFKRIIAWLYMHMVVYSKGC